MHQYHITVSTICHPVSKRSAVVSWMTCCQKAGFMKAQVIMHIRSSCEEKDGGSSDVHRLQVTKLQYKDRSSPIALDRRYYGFSHQSEGFLDY